MNLENVRQKTWDSVRGSMRVSVRASVTNQIRRVKDES